MVFSLHTHRKSVKNPHLFLLLTRSNDYYNTDHSLLEKSLVCHFIDHLVLIIWRLILLCSSITFSSVCIVIIKNILWEEGTENYFLSDLRVVWSDKSSFQSSPKSNWWTRDEVVAELLTLLLQIIKSYPQNKWQTSDFLVQSYLKLGKSIYFYKFLMDNF